MSEEEIQKVEVVEPVVVHPRHKLFNGYRWITVGFIFLSMGSFSGLLLGYLNNGNLCETAKENRRVLRQLIRQGDPILLEKGEPGFDYWEAHPEERSAAHERVENTLENITPEIKC